MTVSPLYFILVAAAAIGLAGECSAQQIKIGILTELTGQSATAVQDCKNGLQLANTVLAKAVNARSVQLVFADSQEDPRAALSEFQKLSDIDGVHAVVSTRSKIAIPLGPVSEKKKVPLLATSAHPSLTQQNPYALRVYPSAEIEGPFLAAAADKLGSRRIAVVTTEDEWNVALSSSFVKAARDSGSEIVFNQAVDTSVRDFGSLVSKIKSAAADTIFINLLLSQAGNFAKRLAEQEVRPKLLSNFWIQMPESLAVAGPQALEGVVFSEVDFRKPQILAAYKALFVDRELSASAYYCYAILATAIGPLRGTSVIPTREEYRNALLQQTSVQLLDETLPILNREVQFVLRTRVLHEGAAVYYPRESDDAGH